MPPLNLSFPEHTFRMGCRGVLSGRLGGYFPGPMTDTWGLHGGWSRFASLGPLLVQFWVFKPPEAHNLISVTPFGQRFWDPLWSQSGLVDPMLARI